MPVLSQARSGRRRETSRCRAVALGRLLCVVVVAVLAVSTSAAAVPFDPRAEAIGYGRHAVGGAGGSEYWVTTTRNAGPGSLRYGLTDPQPLWIRFAVDGEIELEHAIRVGSDKTVDGRGADITITGDGLELEGVENVVIRNIRFADGPGGNTDAIRISQGTRDVWIDHCELRNYGDGLIDITQGSTDITVSWSVFADHDKVMLVNIIDQDDHQRSRVTVHHNLFDGTGQRHPLVRHAFVHAFNNVLRDWRHYGMQSSAGGQLFSHSNVFDAGDDTRGIVMLGSHQGAVRSAGDLLLDGAEVLQHRAADVPDPADDYEAAVETADEELQARVARRAGWQDVGYAGTLGLPLPLLPFL